MVFEPKTPPTILPVIVSDDYEAFRSILSSHIPNTYNKWLNLLTQWEKEWSSNGTPISRVNVNSREFTRHLDSTGHAPALNELFVFAAGLSDDDRN